MLGPQDIKEADVKESEEAEKPQPEVMLRPVDDAELDRIAVARSLGIEGFKDMKNYTRQLDVLIKWANQRGAKDKIDMLGNIKQMQGLIGYVTIHDMVVWAHLDMERMETVTKMAKFVKK